MVLVEVFSYHKEAPLDMRMDVRCDFSAYDVVNTYSENELAKIIKLDLGFTGIKIQFEENKEIIDIMK